VICSKVNESPLFKRGWFIMESKLISFLINLVLKFETLIESFIAISNIDLFL
jgi:hypothetical protein